MIVNRNAGGHGVYGDAERAATRLRDRGISVRIETTGSVKEAEELVRSACHEVGCVVAVGGDGTLRGIVDAVGNEPLPVGVIPRGTANVMAHELGVPLTPERAADALADGVPRLLDLGRIHGGGSFLAMLGVGFDGQIVQGVQPGRFKICRMGLAALKNVCNPSLQPLRVIVDGEEDTEAKFSVVVANTRNYGGWFSLCPDARPDDGRFHYVGLKRPNRTSLMRLVVAATRRRPTGRSTATYGEGREFVIESLGPEEVPIQADGDPCGTTPVRLSIEPQAVAIIAPKGATS